MYFVFVKAVIKAYMRGGKFTSLGQALGEVEFMLQNP